MPCDWSLSDNETPLLSEKERRGVFAIIISLDKNAILCYNKSKKARKRIIEVIIMTNSNMYEVETDLAQLIKILENKEEDVIYIAQDGVKVAQLTLLPKAGKARRIGAAKGKLPMPDDKAFDDMDKEIEDIFEGYV